MTGSGPISDRVPESKCESVDVLCLPEPTYTRKREIAVSVSPGKTSHSVSGPVSTGTSLGRRG